MTNESILLDTIQNLKEENQTLRHRVNSISKSISYKKIATVVVAVISILFVIYVLSFLLFYPKKVDYCYIDTVTGVSKVNLYGNVNWGLDKRIGPIVSQYPYILTPKHIEDVKTIAKQLQCPLRIY